MYSKNQEGLWPFNILSVCCRIAMPTCKLPETSPSCNLTRQRHLSEPDGGFGKGLCIVETKDGYFGGVWEGTLDACHMF